MFYCHCYFHEVFHRPSRGLRLIRSDAKASSWRRSRFLHFLTANKNCKSHFNSIYWHPNVLTHARIKYSGKIIIQKIYKAQVGFSRPFDIFKLLSVCGSRLFLRRILFLHPFGTLKMIEAIHSRSACHCLLHLTVIAQKVSGSGSLKFFSFEV